MAKKKSSSSSGKSAGALLLLVVAVVAIGFLFGWDQALGLAGEVLGIDLGGTTATEGVPAAGEQVAAPAAAEELTGGGDYYTVYFNDPVIPFDDVTTGGNEQYLVELINGAQTSIVTAMFEFDLQVVADALIAAHERGVDVRVVYDDEHTEEDPQIEELIDAGIPATPDDRSAFMHNKFYVFDGQTVWTGSMNITENGVYRNNNNVIVIQSTKLAENYTAEFEEMFIGEFGPRSPENTPNPVIELNGVTIENYFASEGDVMVEIIRVVSGAQSSIKLMTFAFTEDRLGAAMRERGAAGVSIQGIFEQRGANTEYSECNFFLDDGHDVRLDGNPRTFHHKVIIIDDAITVIGSFNFSSNATDSNDENVIIVHDPAVAQLYVAEFDRRMAETQMPAGGVCLTD